MISRHITAALLATLTMSLASAADAEINQSLFHRVAMSDNRGNLRSMHKVVPKKQRFPGQRFEHASPFGRNQGPAGGGGGGR